MSRKARRRDKKFPHHIMSRSIQELNLFNCNEDKEQYLKFISLASKVYQIEVLAYCLMDNHVHILVHPRGGNISKFMKAINNPYARYYNRINGRRGHLFGERFKNIVIKDESHLLRTSTYIHNNGKDLLYQGYGGIEDYPYSSIKDYINPKQGRGIARANHIYSVMGGGWHKATNDYMGLLEIQSQGKEAFEREMEKAFNRGSYEVDESESVRSVDAEKVITVLARLLNVDNTNVRHFKYKKEYRQFKGLLAICLRIFCDMSLSQMTEHFMNHTPATIGILAREGIEVLWGEEAMFNQIALELRA